MSNDLTEPQGGEKYDTTPGVTAILERINQVQGNLVEQINHVRTDLVEQMNHMRTDLVEQINGVSTEMRESDSTILDLIGEVRTELIERINQVHTETRQSNSTIMTRLNDIEGQTRLTNAKLDVYREDLFNTKVQVRDVQTRVDELERKVS